MSAWCAAPERGSGRLVRLMLWLLRYMSWFATGVVLPGISAWFFLFSRSARAASRDYLALALGQPVRSRDVLRHIHTFACAILDRTLLLLGRADAVGLTVEGLDRVEAAVAAGTGCLLFGAHLGSFAVLRGLAACCPVPVRMLMFNENAGPFTRMAETLDPSLRRDAIAIGDVQSMLRAHAAVAAGAVLGVLADRSPPGAKQVAVPFFGRLAPFPAGPFVLAASLGAPVLLFSAVRTGPRRYRIRFEPFAERIVLRRGDRQADLEAVAGRYARWLEGACREHPFNWFNFFPFWERPPDAPTQTRPAAASLAASLGAASLGAASLGAASLGAAGRPPGGALLGAGPPAAG